MVLDIKNIKDKFTPLFTIGVAAKMLNISVQAIRLYEQEGLVLPYKTETGRRMFSRHDVEHISCIKKMISDQGLNFSGIKKILSLIPCWEFRGGLDDDCRQCPAYYKAEAPCWATRGVGTKCISENCRECKVYRMEWSCEKIKTLFYGKEHSEEYQKNKQHKES